MSRLPSESDELEVRIRALVQAESFDQGPTAARSSAGIDRAGKGRRAGRSRRARLVACLVVGLLVGAPVSVVLATHVFPDVPDGTTHAAAIERIAEAGITAGCGGTVNYCPNQAVSRDQMATFLNRSLSRVALGTTGSSNTIDLAAGEDFSLAYQIGEVTITVPGALNDFSPNQFVKIDAVAEIFDAVTSAKGCECSFALYVGQPADENLYPVGYDTFRQVSAGSYAWGISGSTVFPAAPGVQTYEVWIALDDRASVTAAASFDAYLDGAVATTMTFGPTGGDSGVSPAFQRAGGRRTVPARHPSSPRPN
ncbi:MAG: hypothetical protein WKF56_04445 [Candidatus Limnocylindrales bacterium]